MTIREVTKISCDVLEIKNIAVQKNFQRKGYGGKLINFIIEKYSANYSKLLVGTGNSPLTVPKNFFIDNYPQPIYEGGVQLIDMIYFERQLRS